MMSDMHYASVDTFWVKLYIAGDRRQIEQTIREFCFVESLCVTVEDTKFIYKGGEEVGVVIGLLNYPRFPCSNDDLRRKAELLGMALMNATYQESYLIMSSDTTQWFTRRQNNFPNTASRSREGE